MFWFRTGVGLAGACTSVEVRSVAYDGFDAFTSIGIHHEIVRCKHTSEVGETICFLYGF